METLSKGEQSSPKETVPEYLPEEALAIRALADKISDIFDDLFFQSCNRLIEEIRHEH